MSVFDRYADVGIESTSQGPRVRLDTWFSGAFEPCNLYMTPAQAQALGEALIEAANTATIGAIASFEWEPELDTPPPPPRHADGERPDEETKL